MTHRFVERSQTALDDLVPVPAAQHVVFRDVATWDGLSGDVRCHTSVEVRDGLVVAVRDTSEALPADAVVFDGAGKTLIPGLIDMHVHMMYESGSDLLMRAPALMRAWMGIVARYPEGRGDIVRRGQLKLKAGITTIRILGDGYYALDYRDEVASWEVAGPRVFAAGLHVNGPEGYVTGGIAAGLDPALRAEAAVELRSFDEIEPLLERHIARGIDVVKICTTHGDIGFADARPDLPEAWVRRIVEVAHAHGLKVTAHSYGDEGDWAAIHGGVDGIEHLVNVPHALADDMIGAIRDRGIVVCPTLAGSSYSVMRFLRAPELLYKDPDLVTNVNAKVRRNLFIMLRVLRVPGVARVMLRKDRPIERWESWYRYSLANTRALYEAGVSLVFGTDTPFVFGNFHHSALGEMRALREAGLPNLEILKMAKSRAAEVLGMSDRIGSIAPGKVADLVLVNGNPLLDLEALCSLDMVMKEGRVVYGRSYAPSIGTSQEPQAKPGGKVCIVGASGKLGQYMVRQALDRGYDVVGVCRFESVGKLDMFKGRITVVPGDTDDSHVIKQAVAGCDGVLVVLVPRGVHGYSTGTAQAVLDHAPAGARLVFSCGWHITLDGQDKYSRKLKTIVKIGGPIARLARFADLDDQVEACRRVFASNTRWTVVRGSDLEEGEGQGLPVWSQHVGDPILNSNITRRVDFARFMVEALANETLVHQAPAIVGCQTPSALAYATTMPVATRSLQ